MYRFIIIAVFTMFISGCGGHGNASRLLASVNAQTLKNELAEYIAKDEEILNAIKTKSLDSLLKFTGPLAIIELGEEGLALHYSETVLNHIDGRSLYAISKKPKMIEDEKGNIGYLFTHEVVDLEGYKKNLHIGIVRYYDQGIKIRTLALE
jgi:hypothetical protein